MNNTYTMALTRSIAASSSSHPLTGKFYSHLKLSNPKNIRIHPQPLYTEYTISIYLSEVFASRSLVQDPRTKKTVFLIDISPTYSGSINHQPVVSLEEDRCVDGNLARVTTSFSLWGCMSKPLSQNGVI